MSDIYVRKIGSIDDYPSIDEFNREYLLMRDEQERWIENRYDLTTLDGINAIPLRPDNAPGSSESSSTGTVDMYLRRRGFGYEKDGEEELALACLRKSNEIRFTIKAGYRRDDYYSYVLMLVRYGHVAEARREKKRIDKFFGNYVDDSHAVTWNYSLRFLNWAQRKERIEYRFVQDNLPDLCPKSQAAYTRAKNSNAKSYQRIVLAMQERGLVFPEKLR